MYYVEKLHVQIRLLYICAFYYSSVYVRVVCLLHTYTHREEQQQQQRPISIVINGVSKKENLDV